MQVFLVNLERRPDRLAAMTRQLNRLGIAFERFNAVDAKTLDPSSLEATFAPTGPLGPLSPGDKACAMSHLALWTQIGAGADPYAAVIEDDVYLTDSFATFLSSNEWIPDNTNLIKLERYGDINQLVVIGKQPVRALDRALYPLLSRHTGTGGYIISREAAAALLAAIDKMTLPIDHFIFNPNYSPVFDWLKPLQLFPAILDQREEIGGKPDIHWTHHAAEARGLGGLRWRLARNYYDIRLLPYQIALVLAGKARIVKVKLQ